MSAHKNILQTSDFIAYGVILFFLILELFFPTHLQMNGSVLIVTGILFLILSWIIIFTAKYQFKKHNQKSSPNNETTTLIKTGLFSYTRNPIYLGVIFLGPAFGFIINSIWLILAIVPVFVLIHFLLIIPEERYLRNRFGKEYDDYCNNTRRWI